MKHFEQLARVEGPNLVLRLIQPDDAGYVYDLRANPALSTHLSVVCGTVDEQWRWIESYKLREAELSELYYVIERSDATRCGLVRLYKIGDEHFTWGSWILDENKPRKAALESAVLSFSVGFELLGLAFAKIDVRLGNTHATAFYRRLGMTEIHRTARNVYFSYSRIRFVSDKPGYMSILEQDTLNG